MYAFVSLFPGLILLQHSLASVSLCAHYSLYLLDICYVYSHMAQSHVYKVTSSVCPVCIGPRSVLCHSNFLSVDLSLQHLLLDLMTCSRRFGCECVPTLLRALTPGFPNTHSVPSLPKATVIWIRRLP